MSGKVRHGNCICCGAEIEWVVPGGRRLYCQDCLKDVRLSWARGYNRRPQVRARVAAWQQAHPEARKAAQNRCYSKPCPICGHVRLVNQKPGQPEPICKKCRGILLRKRVFVPCVCCGHPVERIPSEARGKVYHPECLGAQQRLGDEIGVSRQRIQQLVVKALHHLHTNGSPRATRADALLLVRQWRGLPAETTALTKRG